MVMITVTVTNLNKERTPITVNDTCTCSELFNEVRTTLHISETSDLKLVFNGKILKPEQTITDYGIKNGVVIVYMISKNKVQPITQPSAISTMPSTMPSTVPSDTSNTSNTPSTTATSVLDAPISINIDEQFIPDLNLIMDERSLFDLRSTMIDLAMKRIVSNRQIFLNVLNGSPEYQNILRHESGIIIRLIVNHPQFLTPDVVRNMIENERGNNFPVTNTDNTVNTANTANTTNTVETDNERTDIDEIYQIFPDKSRNLIARIYNECGKNKESTINFLLAL